MKQFKDKVIIGIDHDYGNIKTANHIFKAGVAAFDSEPVFQTNMLTYGGKYYLVGEGGIKSSTRIRSRTRSIFSLRSPVSLWS